MKITKPLIIISLLLIFLLAGCKAIQVDDSNVKAMSLDYLCDKYDAEIDEFELLDYESSHIEWSSVGELLEIPKKFKCSLQFRYNGREFFVIQDKGRFYDDYQLEDIEGYCTELLKKEIDNRIKGVKIDTYDIIRYYRLFPNVKLEKNNAKQFLSNIKELRIYYLDIKIDKYNKQEILNNSNNLSKMVKEAFEYNGKVYAIYNDHSFKVDVIKSNTSWYRELSY